MKNALEENRWLLWLGPQRQTVDARERVRDVVGAVLVGNVMSAVVGVAVFRWLGPTPLSAALAAGPAPQDPSD